MNSDYYKEVRLQMLNDEKPKACMRCYNEEDNGIKSKRIHEQSVFPQNTFDWASGVTREGGDIDMDLRFVELRLGNVCNVRCALPTLVRIRPKIFMTTYITPLQT